MKATHTDGPGLRVLGDGRRPWYGAGYCGICGDRGESLVPVQVRWWDCDDGWKVGVLCVYCGEEAAARGPREEDYAYRAADPGAVDAVAELLGDDHDGTAAMVADGVGA